MLDAVVGEAFPGSSVEVEAQASGHFVRLFRQPGLLRPLGAAELSDGTLRHLLWVAALLTPNPPTLMVLNEPENSLQPDLLTPLGRLIADTAEKTQVWVATHSATLIAAMTNCFEIKTIRLAKELGRTTWADESSNLLHRPGWRWPDRG